ncbi:MAG: inositol monophosphatase [Bdellovibrionales bacterium]
MSLDLDALSKFLEKISREAGDITLQYFRKNVQSSYKDNGKGIVTQADLASEKHLLSQIKKEYPDHHIITEESGLNASKNLETPYLWIIDPLDGTTNFSQGSRYYCISIAFCEKTKTGTKVLAAGVYAPAYDDYYSAQLGKGSTCNSQKIQVKEADSFEEGYYATGFSYNSKENLKKIIKSIEAIKLSGKAATVRVYGAAALDISMTAHGICNGFWELNLSSWDMAAGALLIEEAGGIVTNFKGEAFDPLVHTDIVGGPASIHSKLLQVIKENF